MNSPTGKFTISLLVFSVILGVFAYGLTFCLPSVDFSPGLPLLFPFFFAVSALIFFFLTKSTKTKFSSFINRFMIATFLKLMIYFIVLLGYVFTHRGDAVRFIFAFFILYVAYTAFEVVAMLKFTKQQ